MDAARFAFGHGGVWKVGFLGAWFTGEKALSAGEASEGIVVLGEASEARVRGGKVR